MAQGMAEQVAQWEFEAPSIPAGRQFATNGPAEVRWSDEGKGLSLEYTCQQGFFVGLLSWAAGAAQCDLREHPIMAAVVGRRVRVTIEVVD